VTAIRENGLKAVSAVKACTKASSGCGTCAGLVQDILKAVCGAEFEEEKKTVLCSCVPFPKEQLRAMIQTQQLKKTQDVLDIYGDGVGCSLCKPALSFIVDEVWLGDHEEDRSARFINDRVHANIQKDGTFSVVPRMRGGVTSPEELRKIADVADKYNVRMVKVTGSQRLDLLGVKKEDLPKIWAELGMTSGYAYVTLWPLEEFELTTAAIFDLGVFLSVLGAVLLTLASLSRLALRQGERANTRAYDSEGDR